MESRGVAGQKQRILGAMSDCGDDGIMPIYRRGAEGSAQARSIRSFVESLNQGSRVTSNFCIVSIAPAESRGSLNSREARQKRREERAAFLFYLVEDQW